MKREKGFFAIKVDFVKASDKLNWKFIWRILEEADVNIIMQGVTNFETNNKWSSTASDYFCPCRRSYLPIPLRTVFS